MKGMQKGVACRICKHNKDGVCDKGHTLAVNKIDECWTFQHKGHNNGLAEHGEINTHWNQD